MRFPLKALIFALNSAIPELVFASESALYDRYDELLSRYVSESGVDYAEWKANEADVEELDEILAGFSTVDYRELEDAEATAFLINLYNAAVIREVLTHYPFESIRYLGLLPFSIFRLPAISLNGEFISLDTLEKKILLPEYGDPRIHFAINCASISCPPLREESFRGDRLEDQLQEQTIRFANSPEAADVLEGEAVTAFSKIFEWYDADFPGTNPASYLNSFRSDPLPTENEIRWIEYNWDLNDAS